MTSDDPTVDDLQAEASALVFKAFDEDQAWQLGSHLVACARRDTLGVVINIRTANRTLFHASTPGSAALNDNWARRKSNAALMFAEASLLIGTRNRLKGQTLVEQGLDLADYADLGGSVPICVAGVGMVAVVTVSGLPEREDHAMVVAAIRHMLL